MKRHRLLVLAVASISLLVPGSALADGQIVLNACSVAPSIAPLAPTSSEAAQLPLHVIPTHKKRPKIIGAAIESTNINHIKFREYYIDWTGWMSDVVKRWSETCSTVYTYKPRPTPQIIEFTCRKDGSIADVTVLQGSGDYICDTAQIEALKETMPLPAFPQGTLRKEISLLFIWEPAVDKNRAKCKVQISRPVLIMDSPDRWM